MASLDLAYRRQLTWRLVRPIAVLLLAGNGIAILIMTYRANHDSTARVANPSVPITNAAKPAANATPPQSTWPISADTSPATSQAAEFAADPARHVEAMQQR